MPDIKDIFVNNLKYYLNLRGKSQTELANYLGVSKATITNYINGVNLPRMDKVDKICQFLFINRSDLLEEKKGNNKEEEILLLARNIKSLDKEKQELIITMVEQLREK